MASLALSSSRGLALAGVQIAPERRKSRIAGLSKPTKIASMGARNRGALHAGRMVATPEIDCPFGAAAATANVGASPPEHRWESSDRAAVAWPASERKTLLVDFGASWCKACKELEEKTFPDPRARVEGARYVALNADATNDDDPSVARVRERCRAAAGLPVSLLFDGNGKEALGFTELVPPHRLAAALASVR